MPGKKLSPKLRRQVEEKEKQIMYQRQQNSIERLSIPAPSHFDQHQTVTMDVPRKANQGLHMHHEHPVITRDMQMPLMRPIK